MTYRTTPITQLVLALSLALVLAACGRQAAPPPLPDAAPSETTIESTDASELFISEYIEGSSLNKAIEIYNGTEAPIDLDAGNYSVQMYFNGSSSPGTTIELTGSIAVGDVFVIANAGATSAIVDVSDLTSGLSFFNGDDAVVLLRDNTPIDVIGQIGSDPGSQWGTDPVSTQDNTLRRLVTVCAGDPDGSDAFEPSGEWEGFAQDTFDGLGTHTAECDAGGGDDPDPNGASLVVNEVDYDQPGTDAAEFLELKNVSGGELSLLGFTVQLVNGSGATVYDSVALPDVTLPAGGYFVLCGDSANVENCDDDRLPSTNAIQNGSPDAIVVRAGETVIDAVTYEGDLGSPFTEGSGSGLVDPGGVADVGLSRIPDGADTNDNDADFQTCAITPGAENDCGAPEPEIGQCGAPATRIHEVQGTGGDSPLAGNTVVIEGVVVGDFQEDDGDLFNTDLDGFFVQEEDADRDSDPVTSEGVFVYAPGGEDVQVGDVIRLEGGVSEFFDMTQVTLGTMVSCTTGADLPTVTNIAFPLSSLDALEAVEGMYVTVEQEMFISEFFNFDRFGEIVLAAPLGSSPSPVGRHFQPTSYLEPGAAAAAELDAIGLHRITLDDGRSNQNPDPARHPNGDVFDLDNRFRGGDTVTNVAGVLNYSFGRYRIQPTQGAEYVAVNQRSASPDPVGGNVTVATLNVLNYFSTIDLGADVCGPFGGQECRGADTATEFTRQRDKIFAALAGLDADVVGLVEIENDGVNAALTDLVNGLNAVVGSGTYAAIETGPLGTDAIRVALIYKPASVMASGSFAVLDTPAFVDPNGIGRDLNRPALAQTFMPAGGGDPFTVVVNHFKSKGSACGAGDDDDLQGSCNVTRRIAAQELLDWLATDPTASGSDVALLIGDYNAYDEEDPIDVLLAGGYADLLDEEVGEDAYTFVFDGQLGHLDYAFASGSLQSRVTGATVWAINADEPDILDYDTSFKEAAQAALYEPNAYRSSDHDPVLVGLDMSRAPVCTDAEAAIGRLWPVNHKLVSGGITGVSDPDGDPVTIVIDSIFQDEPVNADDDGNTAPDAFIGLGNDFEVRAERDGEGNGRVYHVSFTASDATASCTGTVQVAVNLNQGRNGTAVDDGALYDSTSY